MKWFRRSKKKKQTRVVVIRFSIAALVTFLAGAVVVALIGKVPNRQWNATQAESVRHFHDAQHGVPYSISVVELDDQGVMWDPKQLEWSLDHLEEVFKAHPSGTIVMVFVHGWKSDASWSVDPEGRLSLFRRDLERIATRVVNDRDYDGSPGIAGVYIGWRGRSFTFPGTENLTFWNRRVAAHRAASVDLLEILLKINQITRSGEAVKLVMMGHSMGGLIVEKVLAPAIVTSALSKSAATSQIPVDIDLVVSANPATSALDASRLIEFFERNRCRMVTIDPAGQVKDAQGPIMVSINSEADLVNRISFPLGMWVNGLFLRYRRDSLPGVPSQRTLGIRAAGHEPTLVSHTAEIVDGELVLKTCEGHSDELPYWVIRVSDEISSGHSDVTNPWVNTLITDLMDRNHVFDPDIQLALQTGGSK